MARLRIPLGEQAQFPQWWTTTAVEAVFDTGPGRPDAIVLPMPTLAWTRADFARTTALAEDATIPTVIYNGFDSWDDPSRGWRGELTWVDDVQGCCRAATVVGGPQLPPDDTLAHPVALPYPPLVDRLSEPPELRRSTVDVHFAGFFREPGWAAPPADPRDRRHRGHLVARLAGAVPADRLAIRNIEFWAADEDEQRQLRECYVDELDRAALVLAPAGYGHLTYRHADTWARGRALLCDHVQRHVLVPEPERWDRGEIAVLYDSAADDIAAVVTAALADPERLDTIARAGWSFGRRWTTPEAQAQALADALAEHC
jgi:hypothetical protein